MDKRNIIASIGILAGLVTSTAWPQSTTQYYDLGLRFYNENKYHLAVEYFAIYQALEKQAIESDPQFRQQFNEVFDFSKQEVRYAIETIQQLRQQGAFIEYEVSTSGKADTFNEKTEKRRERVKHSGRKPTIKRHPPKTAQANPAKMMDPIAPGKFEVLKPPTQKAIPQQNSDQCRQRLQSCMASLKSMQEKHGRPGVHPMDKTMCDEERDWLRARRIDTVDAYRSYIMKCNPATYTTEATHRINELRNR